uniref:Uncharacterized protein n=1 Tax=Megaviridae environmental sample TaxID=1737588 RepID=A0A5J6VIG7_9VIRU|nr:MAG: hypothetical protein [Megaviridae environmental sample]
MDSSLDQKTAIMSISGESLDCMKVANILIPYGFNFHIMTNITCSKNKIENGCQIVIPNATSPLINNTWKHLYNNFDISCAHLNISSSFSGCIFNYMRKSACPN